MNEKRLEQIVEALLNAASSDDVELFREIAKECEGIRSVSTFEDCGVMTMNCGLVIAMQGNGEFQLTLVQSR